MSGVHTVGRIWWLRDTRVLPVADLSARITLMKRTLVVLHRNGADAPKAVLETTADHRQAGLVEFDRSRQYLIVNG
jgi:hypothetical protein